MATWWLLLAYVTAPSLANECSIVWLAALAFLKVALETLSKKQWTWPPHQPDGWRATRSR